MPCRRTHEVLVSLPQVHLVEDYKEIFELISAPLRHVDEEVLKGAFMNGLKEVRAEVRLHSLGDLGTLMILVQRVEERNRILGRPALESLWIVLNDPDKGESGGVTSEEVVQRDRCK
ncbi:hypothetical protein CR513_40732, partial [Mucuna pruriens]